MKTINETLLKSYNDQIRNVFIPKGVSNPEDWDIPLRKDLANTNEAQLLYVNGGLFSDCCLERPVMNVTLTPMRSLANRIPVFMRNTQRSTYALLTGIDEPTGSLPENPCDNSPQGCNFSACYIDTAKGRMSFETCTLEMDAIIEKLCRGVHDDLFFIGNVRGVSDLIPNGILENSALIAQGAVRRQIQLLGRYLQREVLRQFWTGDPTNPALNTAGGGARQFWGLDFLIADDYDRKPFVRGDGCDQLNSDVKDFENTCIGGRDANGFGIYSYMQAMEDTLFNRAALHGYSNVEWVWVMHPIAWSELVKTLPCEMLSDSCAAPLYVGPPAVPGVTVVSNDMGQVALRQELQSTMRIPVNGRTYQVILDDSAPLVNNGGTPPTYTTSIYFVPLVVDGQPVLFWDSKDYRVLEQELSPVPGGLGGLHGWTDGGTRLLTVEHRKTCFHIWGKAELSLILLSPYLAGRIDNVNICPLQTKFTGGINETPAP